MATQATPRDTDEFVLMTMHIVRNPRISERKRVRLMAGLKQRWERAMTPEQKSTRVEDERIAWRIASDIL